MIALPKEEKISTAELAVAMGVSVATVWNWREAECPCYKEGTARNAPVTFVLAEVQAWRAKIEATVMQGERA